MDEILQEVVDRAYEAARLGRNGAQPCRERLSAEMLTHLEGTGDAMRLVDTDGQIRWSATPNLCQRLTDLELDAEADLENI
jgi:hypothetical protein